MRSSALAAASRLKGFGYQHGQCRVEGDAHVRSELPNGLVDLGRKAHRCGFLSHVVDGTPNTYGARLTTMTEPNACERCQVAFTPTQHTKWQRFCSDRCRVRAWEQQKREGHQPHMCRECGLPIVGLPSQSRYCSKECKRAAVRGRQKPLRWRHVARRYGLAPEDFDRMLAAQDGRCAICSVVLAGRALDADSPQVDHDHETDQLRAILCRPCNTALGMFDDNVPRILRAVEYLQTWSAKNDPRLALVQ